MHSGLVALAVALTSRCALALPVTGKQWGRRNAHRRELLAAINFSKPHEVYSPENDWTNDANNYLDDYISRLTDYEQSAAAQGNAGEISGAGGTGEAGAAGGIIGGGGEGGVVASGAGAGDTASGTAGSIDGGAPVPGVSEPGVASGAGTSGVGVGGEAEAGASAGATSPPGGPGGPAPEELKRLSIRDIDYIVDQPNYVEQFIAPKKYAALESAGMSDKLPAETLQVPVNAAVPAVTQSTPVGQRGEPTSNFTSSQTFLYRQAQEMQMQRGEQLMQSSTASRTAANTSSDSHRRKEGEGQKSSTKGSEADSDGMVREAWKKAENADKDLDNIVKDVLLASSA